MPQIHNRTAGIALDDWKLPIFERHLRQAGYAWTQHPGLTAGTLLLKVHCESTALLEPIVRAANEEAALTRKG
jgi:hypothetical protein